MGAGGSGLSFSMTRLIFVLPQIDRVMEIKAPGLSRTPALAFKFFPFSPFRGKRGSRDARGVWRGAEASSPRKRGEVRRGAWGVRRHVSGQTTGHCRGATAHLT